VLSGAGLVDHRSVGTRNLYALAPEGLVPLQQWLIAQWDTVLDAFATFVDEHQAAAAVGGTGETARGTGEADDAATDPS
jgi:hypothetical protein